MYSWSCTVDTATQSRTPIWPRSAWNGPRSAGIVPPRRARRTRSPSWDICVEVPVLLLVRVPRRQVLALLLVRDLPTTATATITDLAQRVRVAVRPTTIGGGACPQPPTKWSLLQPAARPALPPPPRLHNPTLLLSLVGLRLLPATSKRPEVIPAAEPTACRMG